MDDLPEILTLTEVASLCRVTPVTIHRWIKRSRAGEGQFPKPLGTKFQHLRFSKNAILRYLHGESSPVENHNSDRHSTAMESLRRRGVIR